MSQGTFSDTLIRLEALKRIFVFRQKIDSFKGVRSCFLAKNDHIFKWAFFTRYVPKNPGVSKNSLANHF